MLTQGAALRFAESAAGWIRRRDLRQWLHQAIVITSDDGKYSVIERGRAVDLLEKVRDKALGSGRRGLADDLAKGIDVVKAAAPIDVPVIVFIERGADVETGVITLSLPTDTRNKA